VTCRTLVAWPDETLGETSNAASAHA